MYIYLWQTFEIGITEEQIVGKSTGGGQPCEKRKLEAISWGSQSRNSASRLATS